MPRLRGLLLNSSNLNPAVSPARAQLEIARAVLEKAEEEYLFRRYMAPELEESLSFVRGMFAEMCLVSPEPITPDNVKILNGLTPGGVREKFEANNLSADERAKNDTRSFKI